MVIILNQEGLPANYIVFLSCFQVCFKNVSSTLMLQVTVQQRQFLHKNRREFRLFVRQNNFKKLKYSHPCYPGSKSRQKHRRTLVEFSPLLQEVISASQKEFFLIPIRSKTVDENHFVNVCLFLTLRSEKTTFFSTLFSLLTLLLQLN